MAIMINLLPDIRLAKLKAKRRRRLATGISVSVVTICLGVLIVLIVFLQAQKIKIADLSRQIITNQAAINDLHDLSKILTTQQHLSSIPGLIRQRAYMTKFYTLLGTISPKDVALKSINLDGQNGLKFSAKAKTYASAAKLAKALEVSNVTLGFGSNEANQPHFSNVELGPLTADTDGKVTFTANATMAGEVTNGGN